MYRELNLKLLVEMGDEFEWDSAGMTNPTIHVIKPLEDALPSGTKIVRSKYHWDTPSGNELKTGYGITPPAKCAVCGEKFSKDSLTNGLCDECLTKPRECSSCRMERPYRLFSKVRNYHGEATCDFCFMARHTGSQGYTNVHECPICALGQWSEDNLLQHRRFDHGEKVLWNHRKKKWELENDAA